MAIHFTHLKMDSSERAVCDDLSRLKAEEQHAYYLETCEDLGLDPATFPLRWIVADGRLALAVETCIGATASKTRVLNGSGGGLFETSRAPRVLPWRSLPPFDDLKRGSRSPALSPFRAGVLVFRPAVSPCK